MFYAKMCVFYFPIFFRVTLPCVVHLLSYAPPNGGNQSKNYRCLRKINCVIVAVSIRSKSAIMSSSLRIRGRRLQKSSAKKTVMKNLSQFLQQIRENVELKDLRCRLY
jgi:hypothetical protein